MITLLAALSLAAEPVTATIEGHAYDPVWSPDGAHLLVNISRHDEEASLWKVALEGGAPAKITLPGASNPFSGAEPVAMNPVWSSPGAFVFEGTDPGGRFRIFEATGDTVREVQTPRTGHLTFPSLAADGALAFVADETGHGDIYLRTPAGSERQLTETDAPEMFPQLSRDGATIIYSRKVVASEDLFARDLATGVERLLVGGAGDQTRPVHAGSAVLFFDGSRGPGHWDLVAVEPSGVRRVLARDVALPVRARPAVSPDGRYVAFTWAVPGQDSRLVVSSTDGSWRLEVPTAQIAVGEPALGMRDGRLVLAWTALPGSGSNWRQVYVEDLTDRLEGAQNNKQNRSER